MERSRENKGGEEGGHGKKTDLHTNWEVPGRKGYGCVGVWTYYPRHEKKSNTMPRIRRNQGFQVHSCGICLLTAATIRCLLDDTWSPDNSAMASPRFGITPEPLDFAVLDLQALSSSPE